MKVDIWLTGKTKESWVEEAMDHYLQRVSRYATISTGIIAESKYREPEEIRRDESARILARIRKGPKAFNILLDENGKQRSSLQFAELIETQQSRGSGIMRFIIGGAYGVDHTVREGTDFVLSLSAMTFPHQLVRIIFLEQLYSAFTILRREVYHH
jgi:23S rRNA (pseudouridine1915-N3)-methyltransferase